LIGKCPIATVDIAGFKVRCLVDTGSTVSTLTESFYYQFLKESTNLQTDISIKLKAANGICIPYVGYIEVDMNVMGQNLLNRGVLIVKDSIDSCTRKRKESIPGLLGMNVISAYKSLLVQDFGNQYTEEITKIVENFKLKELFKACDKDEHSNALGFIKLCASSPVRIPANSVTVVNGTGPNLPRLYDAIVEPLQTTGHLPASFIVVHTFVTVRNGHVSFRIANIGHDDIWITPRTRVGILLKGDIERSDNGKIELMRTEFTEEIYVNEDVHCSETCVKSSDLMILKCLLILAIYLYQLK